MSAPDGRGASAVLGRDREMIRLVAELYYVRGLNQPEIATLTHFSVSKVSRLLALGRDSGIVRITIEPPSGEADPVAAPLTTTLGVEIHVTPGRESSPAVAARLCGVAAVEFVMDRLPETGVVGLGGGYTVEALVAALPRLERPGITVVPLVGGWDARNQHLDVNEAARRMADRLGATAFTLHAPGMLDSEATRDALLRESAIAATTTFWEQVDWALIGVSGGPHARPGYNTVMDRLDEGGRERLAAKGVVGDISGHLFAVDGSFVDDEWTHRTLSIPLDRLRRARDIILVAAGSNKVAAIVGAARTGVVTAIVTDRPTAEAALRLARSTEPASPARASS